MEREIRVTIEVLDANGTTIAQYVCLAGIEGAEPEAGYLGDIESAIDELLEPFLDEWED